MSLNSEPNLRRLKFIVIFLGVLLVAGMAALIAAFVYKFGKLGKDGDAGAVMGKAAPAAPVERIGRHRIDLRPGETVGNVMVAGDRLVVTIRAADGNLRVLVLALGDGRELGGFDFRRP